MSMSRRSVVSRIGVSVAMGVALATWFAAEARDESARIDICRHRKADGRRWSRVDLRDLDRRYRNLARQGKARVEQSAARVLRHDAKHPACRRAGSRTIQFPQPLPGRARGATFYFIRIPKRGLPRIVPRTLPRRSAVFALNAGSAGELARVSKGLGVRISLANREFARALGVRCADTRVVVSRDGRTAALYEESR